MTTATRTPRPSPRPEIAQPARPAAPLVHPGDTVEWSLTAEITLKGGNKVWLKAGATVEVQPNETARAAYERVSRIVEAQIERETERWNS